MSVPVLSVDAERAIAIGREPAHRDKSPLVHEEITGRLLAAFFAVHRTLGFGFADAVYTRALQVELAVRDVEVQSDVAVAVFYRGRKVGAYSADLVLDGKVVVSVRTGASITDTDRAQLLNCMRCSRAEVGMLLHFGTRPDFRRLLGRAIHDHDDGTRESPTGSGGVARST